MRSEPKVGGRGVRRKRLVSVRAIAGDRLRRADVWLDSVLRRASVQPRRLEALQQAILEDNRAPFRAPAAIAEIQKFLADPAVYRSPDAVWWGAGEGLAAAHVRHVLDAQALAFADRPGESAEAMERALDELIGPTEAQATAASRHRAMLRALGESFRRDQMLMANLGGMLDLEEAQEADGTRPLLSYLEQQRARRLLFQERFAAAAAALERALSVAGPMSADDFAGHAVEFAGIALGAEAARSPDATSLLASAATRWLEPAVEGLRETQRAGILAYWQGRVALAQASLAEEATAGRDAAARAIDRLRDVRALADPATAEVAESWLPDARRQMALHALRLGDARPAAEALRAEGQLPTAALLAGDGGMLSWSGLAACLKEVSSPLARELVHAASVKLVQKHGAVLPVATTQRLVLELSESVLSTDPKAERLIGQEVAVKEFDGEGLAPDDRDNPSIGALRRLVRARFGVLLPSILVRGVQSQEPVQRVIVFLDNAPVYEAVMQGEHFVRRGGAGSWLLAKYRALLSAEEAVETQRIDAVQYATWHLGQAVLRSLPQLRDLTQARHLGIGDLPFAITHPLLQLLLADRTPLLERDALRHLAVDASTGGRSTTAAAEAFRRVPAVRSSLWGVEGTWEDHELPREREAELVQLLSSEAGAGVVPRTLVDDITQTALRRTLPGVELALGAEEYAQQRLVVRNPALRPWLRAIFWQHPNVPVVTAEEIGLPL